LPPDLPAYLIEPAADAGLRDRLPTSPARQDGPARLLTVGRLTWKKGYVQTLTALAALKSAGLHFTYRIIGEGEGLEEVLYMRRALGLEAQVSLEGRKSHADTLTMMAECDLYIQYSVQEGYCNAVVEAQLLGRPCIVSDAEGLPENVVDGVTGWVVPFNDPERLRAKMEEVLSLAPEERARIGRTASDRIATSFSLDTQLAKFIRFYED
ncbi:MAG: glycosyltransferase, partial [Chitinophagia bacterium]|nr:glycosyltransferase [Chitinophagia bacterium]